MYINKPRNWRTGQTVFNFLEWLRTDKGYEANQSIRMADPFHIQDEDFEKLFQEFLESQSP